MCVFSFFFFSFLTAIRQSYHSILRSSNRSGPMIDVSGIKGRGKDFYQGIYLIVLLVEIYISALKNLTDNSI